MVENTVAWQKSYGGIGRARLGTEGDQWRFRVQVAKVAAHIFDGFCELVIDQNGVQTLLKNDLSPFLVVKGCT